MSLFVLDTNTVSYFFKGQGQVGERLLATDPTRVALPAVVVYELLFGLIRVRAGADRLRALELLISRMTVLPFGHEEARAAAEIRAELEQHGTPIGPMDTLIAATALVNQGVLVTHNTREFRRVPDLEIVDWYES